MTGRIKRFDEICRLASENSLTNDKTNKLKSPACKGAGGRTRAGGRSPDLKKKHYEKTGGQISMGFEDYEN